MCKEEHRRTCWSFNLLKLNENGLRSWSDEEIWISRLCMISPWTNHNRIECVSLKGQHRNTIDIFWVIFLVKELQKFLPAKSSLQGNFCSSSSVINEQRCPTPVENHEGLKRWHFLLTMVQLKKVLNLLKHPSFALLFPPTEVSFSLRSFKHWRTLD